MLGGYGILFLLLLLLFLFLLVCLVLAGAGAGAGAAPWLQNQAGEGWVRGSPRESTTSPSLSSHKYLRIT